MYPPFVRLFCFTLHAYSKKAYEYLREVFSQHLPSTKTIQSWYRSIDGSPGFTESAFDALRQKAEEEKPSGLPLVVGLIFDEMSIRTHSYWDKSSKQFLGHITAGKEGLHDTFSPLASHAFVMMISGISIEFKIPIGYVLSGALSAREKYTLLNEAMFRLHECGVKLASFTFDGARENISTMQMLGAKYSDGKPYFENPFDKGNNVYLILDAPHMLKLARNCLARKGILYDWEENEVKWQHFHELVMLQIKEQMNLGNKVTKTHLEYESNKMNVRLAAQTLSMSTADSIEYLDTHMKYEIFFNSKGTTSYMRFVDTLFNTMNSKSGHCDNEYKAPFSDETLEKFKKYFEYAKNYIDGLKVVEDGQKKSILKTRSFTPYFGFLHNMTSFKGIYNDYVKKNGIEKFYAFCVSQDHIESFFGCIRRMIGNNDNPNELQFKGCYRKLLVCNEISSSTKSNCENDITKILTVSSRKKATQDTDLRTDSVELLEAYHFEVDNAGDDPIENLETNIRAYLASIIESKVIRKIVLQGNKGCTKCIDIFTENELSDDEFVAFKSATNGIFQPCKSTLYIINYVEANLKHIQSQPTSNKAFVTNVLNQMDFSSLYVSSSSEDTDNHDHKKELIKIIIDSYLDYKSTQVAKFITRATQKKLIRHDRLKLTHQLGQ